MDPLDAQIRQVYFSADLSGEQQTKTTTALAFFFRNLEATADASS
jgi:hypothetical protein